MRETVDVQLDARAARTALNADARDLGKVAESKQSVAMEFVEDLNLLHHLCLRADVNRLLSKLNENGLRLHLVRHRRELHGEHIGV
jgi:23S rRNA maturation-related 3'-5' exoribonuclease YhaM